jgi:hypothetical protein
MKSESAYDLVTFGVSHFWISKSGLLLLKWPLEPRIAKECRARAFVCCTVSRTDKYGGTLENRAPAADGK